MSSLDMSKSEQPGSAAQAFPARRSIGSLLLFAAVVTIAYWVVWFTNRDILASQSTIQYYTFENAFPAADGWLALSAFIAAAGVLRNQRWGLFWTIITGGAGLYLGCMDVLFDLENGVYSFTGNPGAASVEIIINVLTFSLSLVALGWSWYVFKRRTSYYL